MAKIRLVLVDKVEIFREGLAKLLESEADIEVVCTCRTGLEAVESAHKHQPDIILVDTELPECSGVEVVQRIHEELSKTNIIVLTHSETDDDLISAARAGAKAYLSKDIKIKTLIEAIIFVAEGGVVVSPPMAARLLQEFRLFHPNRLTACCRVCACNFSIMFRRCTFTVFSQMTKVSAISLLVKPCATKDSTVCSRLLRSVINFVGSLPSSKKLNS